jgi:hypothetical protein
MVDTLAGVAVSMGAIVPIVSFLGKNQASAAGPMINELAGYLMNRGK